MGENENNPGGESVALIVARIDERTKHMRTDVTAIREEAKEDRAENKQRLNNHADRIRGLEQNSAEHKGEEKGRNFSIKRIVTVLGIILSLFAIAGYMYALASP